MYIYGPRAIADLLRLTYRKRDRNDTRWREIKKLRYFVLGPTKWLLELSFRPCARMRRLYNGPIVQRLRFSSRPALSRGYKSSNDSLNDRN